jgi:hypothetical protein
MTLKSTMEKWKTAYFLGLHRLQGVDTDHSEIPQEHKCAHIIALENGNYAAQPNNRIIWSIPSFTVRNEIPRDWKTQTTEWNVEDDSKWKTEDSDRFFYDIEEVKNDKV